MARHDSIHYITVGRLKELLTDPRLTNDMLVACGKVSGDLTIFRPGATKEQECCCFECIIGEIELDDEFVSISEEYGG